MKTFALLALSFGALARVIGACTDAGDPHIPPLAPPATTTDVTITVTDLVGDWDNLHVDGDLTGDTPVAMTQDGIEWTATVADVAPGDYGFGLYWDDGLKAMQPVVEDLAIEVSEALVVSGDTAIDLAPAAGTGFNLVVINHNPAYVNIKIKGEMNAWTPDITGSSADGVTWFLHVDTGLAADNYEWGVIEDDGSEWGIWLLPPGPNLNFDVDAEGVVTGDTTFEIPSPQPVTTLTLNCDMNAYEPAFEVVQVRGTFNGWDSTPTALSDADEDGVWTVELEVEQSTTVVFKFITNGANYESVPSECGVDDGYSGYNRTIDVGTEPATYTTAFGGCPAVR